MSRTRTPTLVNFLTGASIVALGLCAPVAMAQDAEADPTQDVAADGDNVIIVSGIRASLESAMNIKRDAIGVVDAISAEDMGKFPDTNLAESLQRITGVSIDRQSGEGSKVTVRGFGPDFNLVLLNGRQMPASGLGSCCEAPASRSFDFANLASEGIAGVEVYKSGRASLPTGGIGSVINIKTPRPLDRPGFQGSIGVKGVYDHTFDGTEITPEVSGIVSKTFADDTVGVLVSGSYQRRKGSLAQFNAGWREGYLGNENNWGSLPGTQPANDANGNPLPIPPLTNDWRVLYVNPNLLNQIENRPEPTDIYQVTQNAGYDFTNFDRERLNGQAVLQFRPSDNLNATIDYTYSQYTLDAETNSIGVWFNHENTSSSWTDGPAAGPNFYSEVFNPGKDLAITGALAKNRNTNNSLGINLEWNHPSGMRWVLDAHHSTAVSKPTSPYGSNIAVGTAIFGVKSQTVDFTQDMPVISVEMYDGSEINAANIRPSGNAFRTAYMRDRIDEVSLRGGYDFDSSFIESLDFGATYTDNKVRSAYGFLQTDSWGGTDVNPDPAIFERFDTPDTFYTIRDLPTDLAGMNGSQDPDIIPSYFNIDTEGLINYLNENLGICRTPWVGTPTGQGCLAENIVDRNIRESTLAPFVQTLFSFDVLGNEAHVRAGARYEITDIDSSALVPVPEGTAIVSFNEVAVLDTNPSNTTITRLKGNYDNLLPAVDFDMSPIEDVVVRASYSHTITRPSYNNLQGGLTVSSPIRPDGGSTGGAGNPGLLPYLSKNIDLSAEWYYGNGSYLSVGYFHKNVSNFIGTTTTQVPAFDLTNPGQGAIFREAVAAVGQNAAFSDVLAYVVANYPDAVYYTPDSNGNPQPTGILGQANDPQVIFTIGQPGNSDQTAKLDGFEFAIQHNFWDTGFGTILNYTIVNSDTSFDNTLRYTATQFAVTGVSDSANAVLFYDKNGFQARAAYNWRDGFLSGYGLDPYYIEAYGQLDASASYEFDNGITVFAEGINLLNEDRRGHMRNDQTVFFAAPGYARYAAGVRFTW